MEIVDNLLGYFIGSVVNYNRDTRELDVFIPKLMPGIPADTNYEKEINTNMGNPTVNISHRKKIKEISTIRARAKDYTEPMPNIGSKVRIFFLEGQYKWCFWEKFNPYGDYEVIEEEKYDKLYNFNLGNKTIDVYEEDEINIELPEGYTTILIENGKEKNFKIVEDNSEVIRRLNDLETSVGHETYESLQKNTYGKITDVTIPSTGLHRDVEFLNSALENVIETLGIRGRVLYKQISNVDNFDPSKVYVTRTGVGYKEIIFTEVLEENKRETPNVKYNGNNYTWDDFFYFYVNEDGEKLKLDGDNLVEITINNETDNYEFYYSEMELEANVDYKVYVYSENKILKNITKDELEGKIKDGDRLIINDIECFVLKNEGKAIKYLHSPRISLSEDGTEFIELKTEIEVKKEYLSGLLSDGLNVFIEEIKEEDTNTVLNNISRLWEKITVLTTEINILKNKK